MYYTLGAIALRLPPTRTLEDAYWRLRTLSVLLGLATLGLGWAGTRMLFGGKVVIGATAIGALHPQFLLTSISVNPDALVILLGGLMWWLIACAVTGRRREASILMMFVVAATAIVTKRNAAPFVAAAILVALGIILRRIMRGMTRRTVIRIGVMFAVGALILAGVLATFGTVASDFVLLWRSGFLVRRSVEQATPLNAIEYARLSLDYVWLVAGWLSVRRQTRLDSSAPFLRDTFERIAA